MFRRNKLRVPSGAALTIHLLDGETVTGGFVEHRRGFVVVTRYSIESGGVLHEMKGERLHVPFGNVRAVEQT